MQSKPSSHPRNHVRERLLSQLLKRSVILISRWKRKGNGKSNTKYDGKKLEFSNDKALVHDNVEPVVATPHCRIWMDGRNIRPMVWRAVKLGGG